MSTLCVFAIFYIARHLSILYTIGIIFRLCLYKQLTDAVWIKWNILPLLLIIPECARYRFYMFSGFFLSVVFVLCA